MDKGNSRRARDRRLIAGAVGVSAGGDFLAVIPLAMCVSQTTGSGFAVAAVFAALWAPSVLLASLAGRLVDRIENAALLRRVALGQALIALALIPASASAGPTIVVALLLGCGHAIAQAAEFALVPAIAAGSRLRQLNGAVETSRYMGMALGPLAGSALAAAGGLELAFAGNALTFVLVAVAATLLHTRRAPAKRGQRAEGEGTNGFGLILGTETLRLTIAVATVSLAVMTMVWAALPFFARDVLSAGELGYGALMATWTVGMALGATTLAPRVPGAMLATGAIIAIAVQGAGLAAPALLLSVPFAFSAYLIAGVAHGVKNVLLRTLIQVQVSQHLHGRAAAAYNALRNGAELIALAGGGALVTLLGARTTLSLSGALPVIAAAAGIAVLSARQIWPAAAPSATPEAAA